MPLSSSAILRAKHLLCPLCLPQSPQSLLQLSHNQQSLVCAQHHCFDIAKQGYVNLLPVQQKKSLDPGDAKEMVLARKKFLALGYYQPLINALTQRCQQHLDQQPPNQQHNLNLKQSPLDSDSTRDKLTGSNTANSNAVDSNVTTNKQTANIAAKETPVILDAGCGEGYYTDQLQKNLITSFPELTTYCFDIAKPAVIEAAKKNKSLCCFVSTIKAIPILPNSCDLIVSVFSPLQASQFNLLLKNNGKLIVLCAGKNHLHQLKSLLYDITSDYNEDKFLAQLDSHFTLSNRTAIQQTMEMNNTHDIMALLAMTPHFWRASPEAKKQLENIHQLSIDIDVQLMEFTPKNLDKTKHE